jgi:hypothetical protein
MVVWLPVAARMRSRVAAADLVGAVRRFGMEDYVVAYSGLELRRGDLHC